MSEKNPIDDSLNEIEKILKLLDKLKSQEVNVTDFEAINQKIEDMSLEVDQFAAETDILLKESGMTDNRLREALEVIPSNISLEDQEALKKAHQLKDQVLKLKEEMTGSPDFIEKEQDPKKKERMLSKEEHRKKYKRLGSKKKWKPM